MSFDADSQNFVMEETEVLRNFPNCAGVHQAKLLMAIGFKLEEFSTSENYTSTFAALRNEETGKVIMIDLFNQKKTYSSMKTSGMVQIALEDFIDSKEDEIPSDVLDHYQDALDSLNRDDSSINYSNTVSELASNLFDVRENLVRLPSNLVYQPVTIMIDAFAKYKTFIDDTQTDLDPNAVEFKYALVEFTKNSIMSLGGEKYRKQYAKAEQQKAEQDQYNKQNQIGQDDELVLERNMKK